MFGDIPLPYRIAGILCIGAAIFAAGVFAGYRHEHDALVSYRSKVEQAAADQTRIAKEKDDEHDKQTLAVAQSYGDDVNRLNDALARMLHTKTNSFSMPKTTNGSEAVDGASIEPSRTCPSSFYSACLNDALKVSKWQEWAVRQGVPVSE